MTWRIPTNLKLKVEKKMADLPTIKELKAPLASGNFTVEDLDKFFKAGGSTNTLLQLILAGSTAAQQKEAVRGQEEQLGLRQALLNQGAIANLQNRPTVFNPYGGPQELQGSPLAGVDFSGVFGGEQAGFTPLQAPDAGDPGTEFVPDQEGGGGVPTLPDGTQGGGEQFRPSALQLQRQAFLDALKRRGNV
jgi:hypothetical protein